MNLINFTLLFLALFLSLGCASSSDAEPQSKAHPAAYAADDFVYEKDMPKRPRQKGDFYFKHCALDGRKPFPSKDEYECSNPF